MKGLKDQVKLTLNSLLIPYAGGLSVDRLLTEYFNIEGHALPYRWVEQNLNILHV